MNQKINTITSGRLTAKEEATPNQMHAQKPSRRRYEIINLSSGGVICRYVIVLEIVCLMRFFHLTGIMDE